MPSRWIGQAFKISIIGKFAFLRMDRYQKIEKLGEGTYGIVYKAQNKKTGEIVALKRIRLDNEEEGIPCTAVREISLLRELHHPNIVKLHDILHTEKKLTLVFEYLDSDLKKYLDTTNPPPPDAQVVTDLSLEYRELVKGFLYQLLQGVAYCHANLVLHRDLKPQNLLVSRRGELKIADFGLARSFGAPVRSYSTEVVTLWYRPPDVLLGNKFYSTSIDIWSVGCIFAEMMNGKPLFPGSNMRDELLRIQRVLGLPDFSNWTYFDELPEAKDKSLWLKDSVALGLETVVPSLDEVGLDLLCRCLQYIPERRISAAEALEHPFFDSVRDRYAPMYRSVNK